MKGDEMEKRELEQRVDDAQAENVAGTVSGAWHNMVEYTLRLEIERLRAALRKLEPYALTRFSGGQGRDGRWHDRRTCHVCGAVVDVDAGHHVTGHSEDCVFA